MSGPLHIGLIPTVGPYLLPQIIPDAAQNLPETGNVPARGANPATAGTARQRQLDCAILALVKETEAFIEVPLFDEPMKLAVYSDHPWRSASAWRCRIWRERSC